MQRGEIQAAVKIGIVLVGLNLILLVVLFLAMRAKK